MLPRTGKRVAIVQSNYIPWKGYFDLINSVDEFILLDSVQYTRSDWRNRNRIKTANGLKWLTIPVQTAGRKTQRILDAHVANPGWARSHWETLRQNYRRAPYFDQYADALAETYTRCTFERLSDVNQCFIQVLCRFLGISTTVSRSDDYPSVEGRNERLVSLCEQAGAAEYISGPLARAYLDEAAFARHGVTVHYIDYGGYAQYPQLYGSFEHAVTVLDLLFNVGPAAPRYMKSFEAHTTKSRMVLTTRS